MQLTLHRIARRATYTIGRLSADGQPVCDTLEPTDRALAKTSVQLTPTLAAKAKAAGPTAIPTGSYVITLAVRSPRFGSQEFYKQACNGRLPRLLGVPGFDGILIHCGNTPSDTSGCILVGSNTAVGQLTASRRAFTKLYTLLRRADGEIRITID